MRTLEVVLVLALLGGVLWHRFGDRSHATHKFVASLPAATALVQFAVEGFRWQLAAAYLLSGFLAVRAWTGSAETIKTRPRKWGWITASLFAIGAPILLPIPRLIAPDGPYSIGTTTFVLTDEDRPETYGPNPGRPRQIPIHVWYPAEADNQDPPGWLDAGTSQAISTEFGLPGFFLDHLQLTETHAVVDATVLNGDWPIVIYSHGWTGFGRISPDQPEHLASHGFVVFAPDHTYGALVARLPDRLEPFDEAALPDEETVSEAEYEAASRALVSTYAADLQFLLDELPGIPVPGLTSRLDLDRIGIYGHSTGGGAAVALCHGDERCDAVLGFDPWVEPVPDTVIEQGLTQPFLAIRSDPWVDLPNDERLRLLHEAGSARSELLVLSGSNHYDFVAVSQISPLAPILGFKGPIPGPRAQQILTHYLVSFFDETLRAGTGMRPGFDEISVDLNR
jgi:predicted dienelactone hydrolase